MKAKTALRLLGALPFSFVFGCLAIIGLIKDVFKLGFGKVFTNTAIEKPECLKDESLGTHGFLHTEDVRIHYVSNGPEDKPLMLFVHGFPEFWYSWRNQLKEFNKDYRCVAIDMRGYGESDKPSGVYQYRMTQLVKDLKQVVIGLGYEHCTLVAHDWGGAVAWSFARLYPNYVKRLIIMNVPSSSIMQKVLRTVKKQFWMSWYMFFFQLPYLPEIVLASKNFEAFEMFGKTHDPQGKVVFVNPLPATDVQAYKYTFSQPGALSPPLNFYRAAFRYPGPIKDMNYEMPVLLIWGMQDMALCDAIPALIEKENPAITVHRIEDSGHFVQCDAPQKTNEIMRSWLSANPLAS